MNDYSDWDSVPLKDPIGGRNYVLPDDLALLALENCDDPLLIDIQIADYISEGETVWAAGCPQRHLVCHIAHQFIEIKFKVLIDQKSLRLFIISAIKFDQMVKYLTEVK